ncbi:hypothetical protein [Acholeplasma granularum]|uniref:hypothetical protein n=1 Tax=Acholeplasma granularum TaxID=264635 RepID=UPI000470D25F|nr:hypothetical protein [Acholeplasma granularum]
MKNKQRLIFKIVITASVLVFIFSMLALVFDEFLASTIDVIGIRIAAIIIAFGAFVSSTFFSLLILQHNTTVSQINDDVNKRAELFREMQFTASNYSIIEFMDRMLIYNESERYIERYVQKKDYIFHMVEEGIDINHVSSNIENYNFFSFKIPYRVIEGKMISKITFKQIYFERENRRYFFVPPTNHAYARAFLLFNEQTKRNNVIINLIVRKESSFFDPHLINVFSKIKMDMTITSLLGVGINGMSELYFTNPLQIEGDLTNTYKINSANFILKGMPFVDKTV